MKTEINLAKALLIQDGVQVRLPEEVVKAFSLPRVEKIWVINGKTQVVVSGRSRLANNGEHFTISKTLAGQQSWIDQQVAIQKRLAKVFEFGPDLLLDITDPDRLNEELVPAQRKYIDLSFAMILGEQFGLFSDFDLNRMKQRHLQLSQQLGFMEEETVYQEGGPYDRPQQVEAD